MQVCLDDDQAFKLLCAAALKLARAEIPPEVAEALKQSRLAAQYRALTPMQHRREVQQFRNHVVARREPAQN